MAGKKFDKVQSVTSRGKVEVFDESSPNLTVAVRVRQILKSGVRASEAHQKDIMRVMNDNVVVVLDPDDEKAYLDKVQGRTKEKQYTFDIAFNQQSSNLDVYNGSIKNLCMGCLHGQNITVFAYGATGSGKTYTMVGQHGDPGLMVLSLERIFKEREALLRDEDVQLTCSYIEVYNEVVYDLLVKKSMPLDLREDPKQGVCVAGVKRHVVTSPGEIMDLLQEGNRRRKTDSTSANATSSRSHAVLEVRVSRRPRHQAKTKVTHGKLCMVDLAGSERAAETDNRGQKLRDGANINKSLLALANCINALGKASKGKGGKAYVPYRNSKLTRLLKDGLSGNSKTAMIATVSASADQYLNSVNTLKYADRAKEIKTHVKPSVAQVVEVHVTDYEKIIGDLQAEVQDLKEQLEALQLEADLPVPETAALSRANEGERLLWLNDMSFRIQSNSEERINLQKALLELDDATVCNRAELQQLEDYVADGGLSRGEVTAAQERIAALMASINDNQSESGKIREEILDNEEQRKNLQAEIDHATRTNTDTAFLQMVMSFRMQAVKLQEQQFQSAVRDQIISEQRSVINNLWQVIEGSGMTREEIEAIGRQQGILTEGLGGAAGRQTTTMRRDPAGTGALGGLFRTIREAGARANARYEFWRKRERGSASTKGTTLKTGGIGVLFKSIRNFWGGAGGQRGGGPPTGRSTRKIAVAPAHPQPLDLPPGQFTTGPPHGV